MERAQASQERDELGGINMSFSARACVVGRSVLQRHRGKTTRRSGAGSDVQLMRVIEQRVPRDLAR